MNDKELLELAAHAAGIDYRDLIFDEDDRARLWNPLTDDGDALRPAVKLQITVCNEQVRAGRLTVLDMNMRIFHTSCPE
jgi:hypothetical protein